MGDYFPIYHEEGNNYGKGVVLDPLELLRCLLPKRCPCLFWVHSNSKVRCLNFEADQVAFLLQVVAALPVESEDIVESNGNILPVSLLAL